MDLRKLQRIVVDALEDIKGKDIKVFNTSEQTAEFDRVIIASGQSNRQTRALADHVCDKVREAGLRVLSREGDDTGEWVLVDIGDAIVHIMQPDIRAYYNLEEIWGSKPVRMRVGAAPAAAARSTGAGRKPAATKPAAKKPAAKKPAAKAAAKKPAARKPAARKAAAPATGSTAGSGTRSSSASRSGQATERSAGRRPAGAGRDATGATTRRATGSGQGRTGAGKKG
ncbi:MAG: ribosome silencing factor [Burkholderiaceae bacterium]